MKPSKEDTEYNSDNEVIINPDPESDPDPSDDIQDWLETQFTTNTVTQCGLYRKQSNGKYAWIHKYIGDDLPEDINSTVAEMFGGGDYQIKIQWKKPSGRKKGTTRNFSILTEPSVSGLNGSNSNGNGATSGLNLQVNENAVLDSIIKLKNAGVIGNESKGNADNSVITALITANNQLTIKLFESMNKNGGSDTTFKDKVLDTLLEKSLSKTDEFESFNKYYGLFSKLRGGENPAGDLDFLKPLIPVLANKFLNPAAVPKTQLSLPAGNRGTPVKTDFESRLMLVLNNINSNINILNENQIKLQQKITELEKDIYEDSENENESEPENELNAVDVSGYSAVNNNTLNESEEQMFFDIGKAIKEAAPEMQLQQINSYLQAGKTIEEIRGFCIKYKVVENAAAFDKLYKKLKKLENK